MAAALLAPAALAQSAPGTATPSTAAPSMPAPARMPSVPTPSMPSRAPGTPPAPGAASSKPSNNASALRVIKQGGDLCYSADVQVNDQDDADLIRQAEAAMLKTFQSLSVKATQYDDARNCDRELIFTFGVDVKGAPTIYNDDLKLHSYVATDGHVELDSATVWSDGYYGGDSDIWSRSRYTRKMLDNLQAMLTQFATDYRSLR